MKLTKILKSKRGVAIETSVLFIIVIFSLCSMIAMLSLIQNTQTQIDKTLAQNENELEQITEHFLAHIKNNGVLTSDEFKAYVADFDSEDNELSEKYDYEVYGYSLVVKHSEVPVFFIRAGIITENGNQRFVLTDVKRSPFDDVTNEQQDIVHLVGLYLAGVNSDNIVGILEHDYPDYEYALGNNPCSLLVKSGNDTILYIELDETRNITKLLYSDPQTTD